MRPSFLRYRRHEFPLDPAKSGIQAYVHVGDDDLTLELSAEATNTRTLSLGPTLALHAPVRCRGVAAWTDLVNVRARAEFTFEELFFRFGSKWVILPDTPATLYFGEFVAVNHHRFEFRSRQRARVSVRWSCSVVDSRRPRAVTCHGRFALRSVTVWSSVAPVSIATAKVRAALSLRRAPIRSASPARRRLRVPVDRQLTAAL